MQLIEIQHYKQRSCKEDSDVVSGEEVKYLQLSLSLNL
jgi:hypothetical protein